MPNNAAGSSSPGPDRPATSAGRQQRNTILSAPGSKFVNDSVLLAEGQEDNANGWDTENFDDYDAAPEEAGQIADTREPGFDATDDDNLFFQPVPSLQSNQKKGKGTNKQKNKSAPKPGSSFKPAKPKPDEFRREYSKDHPLAPGGTGKYEDERAGGQRHPVGWVDSSGPGEKGNEAPQYPKVVVHQARNPQTETAVKDVQAWQAEIDAMRRQQNQALLKLLEEERLAEEDRGKMGKLVKDHEERHRCVLYLHIKIRMHPLMFAIFVVL